MHSIVKKRMLLNIPPPPLVLSPAQVSSSAVGGMTADGMTVSSHAVDIAEMRRAGMIEANQQMDDIVRQALETARQIESEARTKVDIILKSAEKALKEAEKKGREEGYLRGLVEGAEAAEAAAGESLQELRRMLEIFKSEEKDALTRSEKDIIEIAFEVARKIMKQHIHTDENALQKMLEEVILENEDSYKLYLSEYQKTLDIHIDKTLAAKLKGLMKDAKLTIIRDEDLIMAEKENGIVDMSIPAQIEQLKKAVEGAL